MSSRNPGSNRDGEKLSFKLKQSVSSVSKHLQSFVQRAADAAPRWTWTCFCSVYNHIYNILNRLQQCRDLLHLIHKIRFRNVWRMCLHVGLCSISSICEQFYACDPVLVLLYLTTAAEYSCPLQDWICTTTVCYSGYKTRSYDWGLHENLNFCRV